MCNESSIQDVIENEKSRLMNTDNAFQFIKDVYELGTPDDENPIPTAVEEVLMVAVKIGRKNYTSVLAIVSYESGQRESLLVNVSESAGSQDEPPDMEIIWERLPLD